MRGARAVPITRHDEVAFGHVGVVSHLVVYRLSLRGCGSLYGTIHLQPAGSQGDKVQILDGIGLPKSIPTAGSPDYST